MNKQALLSSTRFRSLRHWLYYQGCLWENFLLCVSVVSKIEVSISKICETVIHPLVVMDVVKVYYAVVELLLLVYLESPVLIFVPWNTSFAWAAMLVSERRLVYEGMLKAILFGGKSWALVNWTGLWTFLYNLVSSIKWNFILFYF